MPITLRSVINEGTGRSPNGRLMPRMSNRAKGPLYEPKAGLPATIGLGGATEISLVYKRYLGKAVYHRLRLQNSRNRTILVQ